MPAMAQLSERARLLAQASIVLALDFLRQWSKGSAATGTAALATLRATEKMAIETLQLFRAALVQNSRKLERMARSVFNDREPGSQSNDWSAWVFGPSRLAPGTMGNWRSVRHNQFAYGQTPYR